MKCINKKKLSAYLDGEVDEQARREIEDHLETCERCQGLAAELDAVSQALDILDGLEPEPFFSAEVKKKILSKKPLKGWRRAMVPVLAGAAAAVSIVLGVFFGQAIYAGLQDADYGADTEVAACLGSYVQDYPDGSLGEVFEDLIGGY